MTPLPTIRDHAANAAASHLLANIDRAAMSITFRDEGQFIECVKGLKRKGYMIFSEQSARE